MGVWKRLDLASLRKDKRKPRQTGGGRTRRWETVREAGEEGRWEVGRRDGWMDGWRDKTGRWECETRGIRR